MTDRQYDEWYRSVTVKELRRWEIADELGLFGESAMTQRFRFLAFAIMAANGSKEAGSHANRILRELER